MQRPTVIELFAGAGGAALGLKAAGFESLACVEWDEDACATLEAAGFPAIRADVREWMWEGPRIDLLWASFPCQCWSTAGKRLGARDTERNGWPWTVSQVDELKPTWLICENVPGLTYHSGTKCGDPMMCARCYFDAVILEQLRERFETVQWAILEAAAFGVPQLRRRVIIVAGPSPIRWPNPTHGAPDQLGLFSILKPYVTVRDALALNERFMVIGAGTNPHGKGKEHERTYRDITNEPSTTLTAEQIANGGPWIAERGHGARPSRVQSVDSPSPPVLAGSHRDNGLRLIDFKGNKRRLTPIESAMLQDFPAGHPFAGNKSSKYRQIGNAVPPKLAEVVAATILATK